MATKRIIRTAVKEEKAAAAEPAKGDSKRMYIIIGIAVAVVAAVILAYIAMSGGAKPKFTAPPFSQLMSDMSASIESLSRVTVNMHAAISMSGQGQDMDVGIDGLFKYDAAAKKSYTRGTVSMGALEQTMENYIIDDITYSKIMSETGEFIWVKADMPNGTWSLSNVAGMLDALGGEVVGEEKVNGKETYKVLARPDVRKFVDYVLEGQDLSSAGLTQEQVDSAVGQLTKSVKSIEMTLWVLKDSSLPIKFAGTANVELDIGEMTGGMMAGAVKMVATFDGAIDYESPVVIELSAAAAAAIDASELYGMASEVCGDGACGETESGLSCPEDCSGFESCTDACGNGACDEIVCMAIGCPCAETAESCPEDCGGGQLVGNDTDVHGCIGSAGYSWCESKQKCLRTWEEECS